MGPEGDSCEILLTGSEEEDIINFLTSQEETDV